MTTTIFDVAKRAGVSIGTVSRVLNNRDRVHPDTRERVLQVVAELGYQRNALARGLALQETRILGLLIPMVNDPFFFEIVRGVEDATTSRGYSLLIASQPRASADRAYLDVFQRGYIDGLVLVAANVQAAEIHELNDRGMAMVLVEQDAHADIPSFVSDNYGGARLMAAHLIGLGHRRIGYIAGTDTTTDNAERLRGLRDVLAEHGLILPHDHIAHGNYLRGSGHAAMQQLLDLPERPQAVFAANDQMALDAIQAARDRGLRVPEDIAVVGFDDISLANYVSPPLTTVAQPAYDMGYHAAAFALDIISAAREGRTLKPQHMKLPTRLVVRRSCGAP
jgi:DNA-binding LacI/PurR family transcriptional regulator